MASIVKALREPSLGLCPRGQKSHPYAIAVINGIVWYNESGVRPDALVRFDPASETFQSYAAPRAQYTPVSFATSGPRAIATC
jgi:streptogramin lyase